MPEVSRRLLPAVGCVLAAAGLAVPGTIGAATAVPEVPGSGPVTWAAERGPVPGAATHTAPALATIGGAKGSRRLIFWTGPSLGAKDFQISYQASISLRKNLWSAPALVASGKATTNSRPAATPDLGGPGQVIVVWKQAKGSSIGYSVGTAGKGAALTWTAVKTIPGAATSNGPAAFTTFATGAILVVWKDASTDAIDFVVGTASSTGAVHWGKIGTIAGAATTTTPAITEAATGTSTGPIGAIYVLWRTAGSTGHIDFAIAGDTLRFVPKWTKPGSLPATITTPTAPSADAVGKDGMLPLLVVFQKPGGSTLEYVTVTAHGAVKAGPFKVPQLQSTNGTAIDPGLIAAEAPARADPARLLDPNNIFYVPYVRPCAGCRPR